MKIRFVQPADSTRIRDIYRPYVEDSVTSFEVTLPTQAEFDARIQGIARDYPYLVCLDGERLVGFAYAHRQMEREAYQWNAELSVYLEEKYQGHGVGKALYNCLLEILALQNIHNVYCIVLSANRKSMKLHESCGFKPVAVFHQTGYKFDNWHDTTWFEKSLRPHETEPQPFLPIGKVDAQALQAILEHYSQSLGN